MDKNSLIRNAMSWIGGGIARNYEGQVSGVISEDDQKNVGFMKIEPAYIMSIKENPHSLVLLYAVEDNSKLDSEIRTICNDSGFLSHKYNILQIVVYNSYDRPDQFCVKYCVCPKDSSRARIIEHNNQHPSSIPELFEMASKYKFNPSEITAKIWECANTLQGAYKPHEYGELLLPLTLIKRLADTFEDSRQQFTEIFNSIDPSIMLDKRYALAMNKCDMTYCNTYAQSITQAVSDPYSCVNNLMDYIDSFIDYSNTGIIRDILDSMEIDRLLRKLNSSGFGYSVLQSFFNDSSFELSGAIISANDMGLVFEDLIKKFNDAVGEGAGQHYTAPDIVKTMSEILIEIVKVDEDEVAKAYDMTMGTSQMLTVLNRKFTEKYGDEYLDLYGQELNGFTYAIACADALIRGVEPDTIKNNLHHGNTLTDDKLAGNKFDYIISNPPFGVSWKAEYDEVKDEFDTSANSRFYWGLPAKSDGQMLFTCNGVSKLAPNGAMAIIHNGSPLFSGNAGSGESAIREGIITADSLIAIIKLPNDMFYNVGITTYIWVVGMNKTAERAGKIQLIDASKCCVKMKKSQGNKRNEINDACREAIVQAFTEFKNDEVYIVDEAKEIQCESKIFDNTYFQGQPDDRGRYKWEIPFDKIFYKAEEQENSDGIRLRILKLNDKIQNGMEALFGTTSFNSEEVQ